MIRRKTSLFALLAAALIAGCVSAPKAPDALGESAVAPAEAWPGRRDTLQAQSDFALVGRVAVVAAGEGINATMRWTQTGDRARIALEGPLGIGGAEILLEGEQFELRTSRGERLDGDAARQELQRRLGFELPVNFLRYWLRGVPSPVIPADEQLQPDAPRLASLAQDGWSIVYPDYMDSGSGPLPRRLTAQRGEARVKIIVDHWKY